MSRYDWAHGTEPFFVFLGLYVATFQAIESKMDQILLLHGGHEHWARTQERLAGLRNHQKVAEISTAATDHKRFPPIKAHREWEGRVAAIVHDLDTERVRRNSILHSHYWLRGLEQGLIAIRTDKKRTDGTLAFDTEEMNRGRMDLILKEIAILASNVGKLHLQLVAWTS